jgi:hypothetical protein
VAASKYTESRSHLRLPLRHIVLDDTKLNRHTCTEALHMGDDLNPFQLIGGSLSGHYLLLTDDVSAVQSSFRPCTPFSQLDRIVHPQSIVSREESLMPPCL